MIEALTASAMSDSRSEPRLRRSGAAYAVDLGFADHGEEDGRDQQGLERQRLDGDEDQFQRIDGVQAQQGDGEENPSLQSDDRREVAETFGDRQIDERDDVEYDQREYHWMLMFSCSR